MIFETLLLLLGLGGGAWVAGMFFQYRSLSYIGATLVLIAGAAVVLTGLEVRTGAVKTISYETVNNSTVPVEKTTEYDYGTVEVGAIFGVGILGSMGLGGLIMLLGTVMLSHPMTEDL